MRLSGRITAAISVLEAVYTQHRPVSKVILDWSKSNRFAGSTDRRVIGDLVYDVLRKQGTLAYGMETTTPRALVLGAVRFLWGVGLEELCLEAETPFGPGALSAEEIRCLSKDFEDFSAGEDRDYPGWMRPLFAHAFGEAHEGVTRSLSERAPVDFRVNGLKASLEKVKKALARFHPISAPLSPLGLRVLPPKPGQKFPHLEADLSFQKGWFELQDTASQVAALLADARAGMQVLDLCAGAGGKTLSLAATMENKGQLFAYDEDPHRLKPIWPRLQRAGVRNVQVIPAQDHGRLRELYGKMDRVFVDAPCSGTGAWRRRPDQKWKTTPERLEVCLGQQRALLEEAARFVKPQGRLIYATCSLLCEENEDQIMGFLGDHQVFSPHDLPALWRSVLGTPPPKAGFSCPGALRLTPFEHGCDGFFVAVLDRRGE